MLKTRAAGAVTAPVTAAAAETHGCVLACAALKQTPMQPTSGAGATAVRASSVGAAAAAAAADDDDDDDDDDDADAVLATLLGCVLGCGPHVVVVDGGGDGGCGGGVIVVMAAGHSWVCGWRLGSSFGCACRRRLSLARGWQEQSQG